MVCGRSGVLEVPYCARHYARARRRRRRRLPVKDEASRRTALQIHDVALKPWPIAVTKIRLHLLHSLYEILQNLSLTMFATAPI